MKNLKRKWLTRMLGDKILGEATISHTLSRVSI